MTDYPAHWDMVPVETSAGWQAVGFEPSGDGYDWMADDLHAHTTFRAVPAWGRDGWDLGDWPYVIVAHGEAGGRFYIVQRVEGDVYGAAFDTRAERDAMTDRIARAWWERNPERGPEDLDCADARGPFSRERMGAGS